VLTIDGNGLLRFMDVAFQPKTPVVKVR